MRLTLSLPILVLCALTVAAPSRSAQPTPHDADTTWTYTYLKAAPGKRAALRQFVEQNWFAMDHVAVSQGLFKAYRLGENAAADGQEDTWDLVVAVEYFADQGYPDIAKAFEGIRATHNTRLVDGLGFRELGTVVRSERLRFQAAP
ncbi:MAG: hypothetical protein AAGA68_13390 [Pseudomonadota bacterium]